MEGRAYWREVQGGADGGDARDGSKRLVAAPCDGLLLVRTRRRTIDDLPQHPSIFLPRPFVPACRHFPSHLYAAHLLRRIIWSHEPLPRHHAVLTPPFSICGCSPETADWISVAQQLGKPTLLRLYIERIRSLSCHRFLDLPARRTLRSFSSATFCCRGYLSVVVLITNISSAGHFHISGAVAYSTAYLHQPLNRSLKYRLLQLPSTEAQPFVAQADGLQSLPTLDQLL